MPTAVTIPADLWDEDDRTGATLLWLLADGAQVAAGDVIAELVVEKVTLELQAPVAGALAIVAASDALVYKGDQVAAIG